jgi:hypothetical protein
MYVRAALACLLAILAAAPCRADQRIVDATTTEPHFLPTRSAAILSTQPRLVALVNRLLVRSRTFAREAARVAARGRHITVVARREVPWNALKRDGEVRYVDGSAAVALPLSDNDGKVRTFLVVIDYSMLGRLFRKQSLHEQDVETDLTRLLIHEIYGHAMPWLLNGRAGGCFDPAPGQLPVSACSIRRENRIRKELGLGPRTDFGLDSFAMAGPAAARI